MKLWLYKLPPVRFLVQRSKSITLPGAAEVSLYDGVRFFFMELRNLKLTERAAAVTYNFLMAMPPMLLFLFSLVPYLPLKNVEETLLYMLKLITANAPHVYATVGSVISDFMHNDQKGILSIGILAAIFFSSNGMMGLMRSFDRSATFYKKRTGLTRRWTALKLTFFIIGVIIVSAALLVIQTELLNKWIIKIIPTVWAVKVLSVLILISIIFFAICVVYTYAPSLTNKFRFISAGSVFATAASVVVTYVFFFIANNIINYNKIYGSIGTLMAFMIWVWLNTMIILIGFELNISVLMGRQQEKNASNKKS